MQGRGSTKKELEEALEERRKRWRELHIELKTTGEDIERLQAELEEASFLEDPVYPYLEKRFDFEGIYQERAMREVLSGSWNSMKVKDPRMIKFSDLRSTCGKVSFDSVWMIDNDDFRQLLKRKGTKIKFRARIASFDKMYIIGEGSIKRRFMLKNPTGITRGVTRKAKK